MHTFLKFVFDQLIALCNQLMELHTFIVQSILIATACDGGQSLIQINRRNTVASADALQLRTD